MSQQVRPQHYDWSRSYDWNYEHAPPLPPEFPPNVATPSWRLCGVDVASPVGIAAGPLLNGHWVLHYAAFGFDVLTYKTVRSRSKPCYEQPNLQPIEEQRLDGNQPQPLAAGEEMTGSWAVSFGMPSKDPDVWRRDVEATRRRLPKEKKLSVSVVASPEPGWTKFELAEDYATCAAWAAESGADFVELNFSCPNVSTTDGQLYQNPELAEFVAARTRAACHEIPLLVKLGHVTGRHLARELIERLGRSVNALVMVNCLAATVAQRGKLLFSGERRGIAGLAIRDAAVQQILLFKQEVDQLQSPLELVGVGGIRSVEDVQRHLDAGATGVQVATSAMLGKVGPVINRRG